MIRQIQTEHFRITSELSEEALKDRARELELIWGAWAVYFRHVPETSIPLDVLLGESGTSQEFVPNSAGFVAFTARPVMVSDYLEPQRGLPLTWSANAHEMGHFVSHFHLRRQPRWIAEGLASYFEDARVVRREQVKMGGWAWPGGDALTLEALWAWDEPNSGSAADHDRYASSAAWFHFFNNREEARFAQVMEALRTGASAKDSFRKVFPESEWKSLHERLDVYLTERRSRGWVTENLPEPKLSAVRVLEPWEVHLVRSVIARGDTKSAEETTIATALNPTHPRVAIAHLEATGKPTEWSDALEKYPDSPEAWALAARSPELSEKRRLELADKAVVALPHDPDALMTLTRLAVARRDPRALELTSTLIASTPWLPDGYFLRVDALNAAGRCPETLAVLEDLTGLIHDGDTALAKRIESARKASTCASTNRSAR